jgi:hypothetical protein
MRTLVAVIRLTGNRDNQRSTIIDIYIFPFFVNKHVSEACFASGFRWSMKKHTVMDVLHKDNLCPRINTVVKSV